MNREAMVEVGAREVAQLTVDTDIAEDIARAVLDAVLPQIASVEQIRELPPGTLLVGTRPNIFGGVPTIYSWFNGELQDMEGDAEDPNEALTFHGGLEVVWRPNA